MWVIKRIGECWVHASHNGELLGRNVTQSDCGNPVEVYQGGSLLLVGF
jgi:hypothetical protein